MRNFFLDFRVCILVLCVISAIPFYTTFENEFVDFDDPTLIYENPLITNFNLVKTFTSTNAEDYLPLVTTSFAIENYFYGLNPHYFHITNLVFHVFNTGLVFILLCLLLPSSQGIAFVIALVFGVHPLHVESVAWLAQRKDMLCTFFSLLSLIYYFKTSHSHSKKTLIASILFFTLALFSKFMAITLPAIIFLIGIYNRENIKLLVKKLATYVVVMVAFAIIHLQLHNSPGQAKAPSFSIINGINNAFSAFAFYTSKLFAPLNLSVFYEKKVALATGIDFLILALFLTFVAYRFYVDKSSRRIYFFMASFFAISIVPVLQIIPFGNKFIFADRFMYLPSIGLIGLIVISISNLISFNRFKLLSIPLVAVLALTYASKTYLQTQVWKNSVTLWENASSIYPNSSVAQNNLGSAYFKRNELEKALTHFERAIEINPAFSEPYANAGTIYTQKQNFNLAKKHLDKALELNPDNKIAYYNLGVLSNTQNDFSEAAKNFEKAIAIDPYFGNAYINLSAAYYQQKKMPEALQIILKLLSFNRNFPEAYHNSGAIYLEMNKYQEAIDYLTIAIKMNPNYSDAYATLIKTLILNSQQEKANELLPAYLKTLKK